MSLFSKSLAISLLLLFTSCGSLFMSKTASDPIGVGEINRVSSNNIVVEKDNVNEEYGPDIGPRTASTEKNSSKTVALVLGPGLSRTIAYSSILTSFERNEVPVHFIVGVGYGAIVAAMYASGMTGSKIEWNFHNFFNQVKDFKAYSNNWNKAVLKYLIGSINKRNIEDFDKVLIIPKYNKNKRVMEYALRGNLAEALSFNINLFNPKNTNRKILKFDYFNIKFFKKLGVDISIGVNVLGNTKKFNSTSSINQIFTDIRNRYMTIEKQVNLFYNLPCDMMPLDLPKNIPEILLKSYETGEVLSSKILERLNS